MAERVLGHRYAVEAKRLIIDLVERRERLRRISFEQLQRAEMVQPEGRVGLDFERVTHCLVGSREILVEHFISAEIFPRVARQGIELDRLRVEPATTEELSRAKENLKGRVVLALEWRISACASFTSAPAIFSQVA